jgi:hypothetical protein
MNIRKYVCGTCGAPANASGHGLKTWHCSRGCPKRRFSVTRRVDSGKEIEREGPRRIPHTESVSVRRAISVRVIAVETA